MARRSKKDVVRRQVTVSVCAPMSVTLIVARAHGSDDWDVESVVSVDAEISARGVMECADDATLAEMDRLAEAAPDLE